MDICFFGDSFTAGKGDDECLGWVGRVVARARDGGWDVGGYNLGIVGNTSDDIARRWRDEAEARLSDNRDGRLVFAFGTNDCLSGGDGPSVRVPEDRVLCNAGQILRAAKSWHPTLMIGPLPVGDDPIADARIEALSDSLGDLCRSLGVPFLPMFRAMADCGDWTREAALGDGSHPNLHGYAALADFIARSQVWRAWLGAPSAPVATRRR